MLLICSKEKEMGKIVCQRLLQDGVDPMETRGGQRLVEKWDVENRQIHNNVEVGEASPSDKLIALHFPRVK